MSGVFADGQGHLLNEGQATLDASGVSNGSYTVSADGVTITAVDEPIEAQVTKVSSADGTALAGATFTLSPADGKNADGQPNHFADASAAGAFDLVTGEDGVAHISGRNARGRQHVRAGGDRGPGRLRPR